MKKIDRDLDMLVDMILRGGAADRLNAKMLVMEQRKRELEERLAQATEPPPLLHPEMASYYRRQVGSLHELLRDGRPAERLAATDILRSLISAIVLCPSDKGLEIDVQGDLTGILEVASNAKNPAFLRAGLSQVELVAGTGFEPALRPRMEHPLWRTFNEDIEAKSHPDRSTVALGDIVNTLSGRRYVAPDWRYRLRVGKVLKGGPVP